MTDNLAKNSKQLLDAIVLALEDKKGLDIIFIDFSKAPNTVARYFVICHGSSSTHVDALANGVIEGARVKTGYKPWNKEGFENAEWILLDYSDVVVHVFQENSRHFYNLEGLWADMEVTRRGSKQ